MHFQYTVFGPLDEFHGFIQICYYECPHISGIYLESLLKPHLHFTVTLWQTTHSLSNTLAVASIYFYEIPEHTSEWFVDWERSK